MSEKKQNGKSKRKIILAVLMILLCAELAVLAVVVHSRASESAKEIADKTGIVKQIAEDALPDIQATLFFASDYQEEAGWSEPKDTLKGILSKVQEDGRHPDNVIYCGDYTNAPKLYDYQLSPDDSISEIRSVVSETCSSVDQDDMIFEQGNHDKLTDAITETGLYEFDSYLVYVLNTQYDFPWKQGRNAGFRDRVIKASEAMKSCFDGLIAKGETRPVFIAGHVPLHFTARTSSRHTTGDNLYSSYIFEVVNEAAESLDIVYLTGHDHSKGWDCYLGGSSLFKAPGETILIPDAGSRTSNTDVFTEEKLNFTYMNAGYTGYYMNCGPEELAAGKAGNYKAADDTLTGTVCEITDDELIIYRYSEDGLHPLRWDGEGNPYKGSIDAGLIDQKYYSTKLDSPAHIRRHHTGD